MDISDIAIMTEVKHLISLGKSVQLPVRGRSMLPFIIGDRDKVELHPFSVSELRIGNAVLAWVDGNHYVIHRIVSINGNRLELLGDGNLAIREHCSTADVIAVATAVITPSGSRSLTSCTAMAKWRLWHWLLPVRRWLLFAYRHL
ncbi:MAG: S24/S26 family peptidase [Muribaculaceae bacterium]